jgi:CRP-like cAMP-binding protein
VASQAERKQVLLSDANFHYNEFSLQQKLFVGLLRDFKSSTGNGNCSACKRMDHPSEMSIQLLRKMPIFGGLTDQALQLIVDQAELISLKEQEYLFRERDSGKSLYALIEGVVQIEKACKQGTIIVGELQAGDCIGEMALIDFQPRSASVRAKTDCRALQIPALSLRVLLKHDIEQYLMIMMNMGREVSRRLRKADERLIALEEHGIGAGPTAKNE